MIKGRKVIKCIKMVNFSYTSKSVYGYILTNEGNKK